MCSCFGSNPGSSCQMTLRRSTMPHKPNEIPEKSEVIQIPGLTPRQEPFLLCFTLKLSSAMQSYIESFGRMIFRESFDTKIPVRSLEGAHFHPPIVTFIDNCCLIIIFRP